MVTTRPWHCLGPLNSDHTAWNPRTGTTAIRVAGVGGASYKGLALLHGPRGPVLLAADFHHARIDVFDQHFQRIRPAPGTFRDPSLPPGYAPFNVAAIGDRVLVTYARQDARGEDEVAGPGRGFVDEYGPYGRLHRRIATRGALNAPWGLAVAPQGFGGLAGDLLVGNFGDGRINVFDPRGHRRGALRGMTGQPIVIEGLWALQPGIAVTGGPGSVWFSAGPGDASHGLVGLLQPGVG